MTQISAQKPETIQKMFGKISGRYDLANSVLSLGIHHVWKRKLVRRSGTSKGQAVLDCATGTGDLAFLFERRVGQQGRVVGTDFCEPMLEKARIKATERGSSAAFEFADVTALQYPDASFDVASISFGIRNVTDPARGLSELGRVVRPGGFVMVLEFGKPESKLMGHVFRIYSERVLPKIGGLLSGETEAYQYLQDSSAAFPCGQAFLDLARSTGRFSDVSYEALQGGIAYLYRLQVR